MSNEPSRQSSGNVLFCLKTRFESITWINRVIFSNSTKYATECVAVKSHWLSITCELTWIPNIATWHCFCGRRYFHCRNGLLGHWPNVELAEGKKNNAHCNGSLTMWQSCAQSDLKWPNFRANRLIDQFWHFRQWLSIVPCQSVNCCDKSTLGKWQKSSARTMLHAEWQKSHDSHEIKVETMTVSNWITFDYFFCRFVSLKTRETKSERIRISIIYVKKRPLTGNEKERHRRNSLSGHHNYVWCCAKWIWLTHDVWLFNKSRCAQHIDKEKHAIESKLLAIHIHKHNITHGLRTCLWWPITHPSLRPMFRIEWWRRWKRNENHIGHHHEIIKFKEPIFPIQNGIGRKKRDSNRFSRLETHSMRNISTF